MLGDASAARQYQYTLQADNLSDLTHWAPSSAAAAKIPELAT